MAKGKLKELFAKKEGGSVVGNALRFVGDKFTGGMYSSMFPKPTDNDLKSKIPTTVVNAKPSTEEVAEAQAKEDKKAESKEKMKKFLPWIIGGVVLVFGVVIAVVKSKKKR